MLTNFWSLVAEFQDEMILITVLTIFLANLCHSFQTRFIQFRSFGYMLSFLKRGLFHQQDTETDQNKILPIQALFTAMSTSIGIGNMVGPIVAIKLGGPAAVIGFILAMFLGSATTFCEVYMALKYRKEKNETIQGGPMGYLKASLGKPFSYIYAISAFILLVCWCSSQSNAIGDMLQPYGVPEPLTGALLAGIIVFILIGGIKRVAEFASMVVPWMFFAYTFSCLGVIFMHIDQFAHANALIFNGLFTDYASLSKGGGLGILFLSLRWGLAKGIQCNEAGLGTASIPHSMSEVRHIKNQAILAMAAVFSNGILCLLTSYLVLMTGAWKHENLGLGINILSQVFKDHYSIVGVYILNVCAGLFVVTTVLGNAYNGSQVFGFVSKYRYFNLYYCFIALAVFLGTIIDSHTAWSFVDYFLIPLAIPHLIGLTLLVSRDKTLKEKV